MQIFIMSGAAEPWKKIISRTIEDKKNHPLIPRVESSKFAATEKVECTKEQWAMSRGVIAGEEAISVVIICPRGEETLIVEATGVADLFSHRILSNFTHALWDTELSP
jgi:hypothetical protein